MKIASVVGARPEFIQAAPVSQALRSFDRDEEILIHTGQHYDYHLSQAFFDQLRIPQPDYNLEVGSGSHAEQTAQILVRIEAVLNEVKPDAVLIRGDTNSTIAAALAAAKLGIPIGHIEAGERSYQRSMPEEINRVVTDAVSDIHFCASQASVRRLELEGMTKTVFWTGDVMLDAAEQHRPIARWHSTILQTLDLQPAEYALVTVHRAANTDDPQRLRAIVTALNGVNERIVFPLHPRTRQAVSRLELEFADHVQILEPVDYFDMMILEENARLIATDSGGVQREAYYAAVPCLTLRDETEWVETVDAGWNRLVGASTEAIVEHWFTFSPPDAHPPIYGVGNAAAEIVRLLHDVTDYVGASGLSYQAAMEQLATAAQGAVL